MQPETSHKAARDFGPSVVNRKLIWTSASGLTTGDPGSVGGCLRKFWYEQVDGRKAPATKSQELGTQLHDEIEGYLTRGEQLASPTVLAGRSFIPAPGPGLYVEQSVLSDLKNARLRVAGIPVAGHVDLWNRRDRYIAADGTEQPDTLGTLETKDWKSTSDFQYAKTAQELAENIQLVTYAEAGYQFFPDTERSRLTHVYFRTRGTPSAMLVTVSRTREQIAERWQYIDGIGRTLANVATEIDANHITATTKSCAAYGGCPHRSYCSGARSTSLDDVFNKIVQDMKGDKMGLLDTLKPQPQPDMRAQLLQEEQALRAQAQVAMPGLKEAWYRIETHKRGTPALAGAAAQAWRLAMGYPVSSAGVVGAGNLGGLSLEKPEHIFQLADELGPAPAVAQSAPIAPIAPIAPQPEQTPVAVITNLLPPDAGEPVKLAPYTAPVITAHPGTIVSEEPKKRGRPAGAKNKTEPASAAIAPSSPTSSGSQVTDDAGSTTAEVYIDCIPNCAFKSLNEYVDAVNKTLAAKYCVDDKGQPTLQDIRVAPKNSVLGFGGWKGAVAAIVQDWDSFDGALVLDTRGNEIAEVVADALRSVCTARGYRYVRGVR